MVVRDQDGVPSEVAERDHDLLDRRRAGRHLLGDPGEVHHGGGDGVGGAHEHAEMSGHRAVLDARRADLDD
jgi:hypothetical protein